MNRVWLTSASAEQGDPSVGPSQAGTDMNWTSRKTSVFAAFGLLLGLLLASSESKAVTINTGESVRLDFDLTKLTYDPALESRSAGFFIYLSDAGSIKVKLFSGNVLLQDNPIFSCEPSCSAPYQGTKYHYDIFGNGPVYYTFTSILGSFEVSSVFEQYVSGWKDFPEEGEYVNGTPVALTPVPLPAALPLLATSLGALAFFGHRRRKVASAA